MHPRDVCPLVIRCVNFEFDQWCQMRKRSDNSGYIKELPVVVCSHLSSNICVKSLLQKTKYKRHLLGSVEQCFYEDIQKTTTPVISVLKGRTLTLLPPEKCQTKFFCKWIKKKDQVAESTQTIMDHKKIVEFYKDLHGVGEKINVLCDFSFLKWLCLHNHDPLPELKDLLSVNKVVLKTTRFENSLFHLWYQMFYERVKKIGHKSGFLLHLPVVCNKKDTITESLLQKPKYKAYFVASNDRGFFLYIQKKTTPVISVTKEKLTLLPLKKSQKKQYLKWLKKEDSVVESSQVRGKKRKRSKPQGETF
ncbi:hypothetical protein L1987_67227 [Smallanthus sonchifolius]|uniref:Uncharacterized protein n=1 Tax=Smallanthus sonchifolius TaxID=185202 RepID=A0ACB9BZN3_9ASTR|nr:hypothetical protein L1987_67227 [Smallanthus sonchifolius]